MQNALEVQKSNFISMADSFQTFTEISKKKEETYPIVVQVLPKDYENVDQNDLPGNEEILLEKPKCKHFALVRIATFLDERQKRKEKGDSFVEERNEYVGQDFLIPLCYPGKFKLLNKSALHGKYSTISQVEQDLPRYIRIDQETIYTVPNANHATSSLDTGDRLEVKSVHKVDNVRYVNCKSVKTPREYIFKSDFEMMCSAVDDPKDHTLLSLAAEYVLLPKTVQFQSVLADDIVLEDDDEANQLLTLTGGPITILKLFVKMNFFVAWLKPNGTRCKTVGLIPKSGWDNHNLEIKQFHNETEKEDYIKTHFGEDIDSNFVMNALYKMKPTETGVIWLRAPKSLEKGECQKNYENVVKKLVEFEKFIQKQGDQSDSETGGSSSEEEKGVDSSEYEEPMPKATSIPHEFLQSVVSANRECQKNYENVVKKLVEFEKFIQKQGDQSDSETGGSSSEEEKGVDSSEYEEPMPKATSIPRECQKNYENVVKKLVEFEKFIQKQGDQSDSETGGSSSEEEKGVDSGEYEEPMPKATSIPQPMPQEEVKLPLAKKNPHVLKKMKMAMFGSDKINEQLHKRTKTKREKSRTENKKPEPTVPSLNDEVDSKSQDYLKQDSTDECQDQAEEVNIEGKKSSLFPLTVGERNRNRPLPGLPQKSYVEIAQKTYVNITDAGTVDVYDYAEEETINRLRENSCSKLEQAGSGSLQDLSNMEMVGRPNQSCEDFYSYTVEKLEDCFKMCSLTKLAVDCSSNKIDGEFFRDLDLNELKSEPFFLSNLEVLKVKQIIEHGWRPKTGKGQLSSL